MRRFAVGRTSVVLVALALALTGLSGAYRYWESYYQHRGFATVALVAGARTGRRVNVNFYSSALGRQSDYVAYLPPGYAPGRQRYPVFYLLHGSPGRPEVFIAIADMGLRMSNLIRQHRMRPMILVYPDGRIGGSTYSDSEWANTRSGAYESFVLDVVRDVDRRFATIPSRGERVIAGFSAGGYGATNVTLHHLGVFGNLQSWSGYYRERHSGVFANASAAALLHNSPLDYVRSLGVGLAADPVRAFLFVGRDDDSSLQIEAMANGLAAGGASVSYALYHGGHDWQLWHAHLNQMLVLASQDVSEPLLRGTGAAGALTPGVAPIPNGRGRRLHPHHRGRRRRRPEHGGPLKLRRPPGALPPGSFPPSGLPPGATPLVPPHAGPLTVTGALSAVSRIDVALRLSRARPVAATEPVGAVRRPMVAARPGARQLGLGELLGGLLLALGSAALINLGFLLQHRGLGQRTDAGLGAALRGALGNRSWLSGQALGWIGFGAQIVAVAIAPLSLVQAFAAGGLAVSVPLAAGFFGHRISRSHLLAVLLIAAGLATLPLGFSTARDRLDGGSLAGCIAVVAVAALTVSARRSAWLRAIAAGAFYGVADAAVKAVAVGWHAHGSSALLSVWTLVAALATFGGFLAFQSALRGHGAIGPISLMNALAALVALACGLIAFGESLGANPVAVAAHLVAIAIVLGCVPVLAAAQAELAEAIELPSDRSPPATPSLRPGYGSSR